jgi:DNA-binding GntR family transcriptional regulator
MRIGMPSCRVEIDRQTLAQRAYADIRSMIIGGELLPGSKVIVRPLTDRLRLSPTPIKSALAALERDGFLVAVPHRGFFVPEVGVPDMCEIYELREALDGIAARRVAGSADHAQFVEAVLAPLHEKQCDQLAKGDLVGYRDTDLKFHRAIWHASGNARLAQVADNMGGQIRLAWSTRAPATAPRSLREHKAIMDALATGDVRKAEQTSRLHVRNSAAAYEVAAASGPSTSDSRRGSRRR